MGIFTERTFLKDRAEAIKAERRALTDEYWKIQERLKELDGQELKSIDTESVMQNLITIVDRLMAQTAPAVKEPIIPPATPEPEPVKQAVQNAVKSVKHTKRDDVINVIVEFLKEQGTPVKGMVIERYLKNKYGWEWNNFTGTMNGFIRRDSRIHRVYRGFYGYKM